MNTDFQTIAAILIVAGAATYLGYAAWAAMFKKESSGCGSCSKCPETSGEAASANEVIPIESLGVRKKTDSNSEVGSAT